MTTSYQGKPGRFRGTFQIKNFTGRMVSDGDLTDMQDGDAQSLQSLRAGRGASLYLDRNVLDLGSSGTATPSKGIAADGFLSAKSFMDSGALYTCVLYNHDTTGAEVAYIKQSTEGGSTTFLSRQLSTANDTNGQGPDRFIYANGIMRCGGNSTYHGAAINPDWATDIYTDYYDGERCAIYSPVVWDDVGGILQSTGLPSSGSYSNDKIGISVSESSGNYATSVFDDKYVFYGISFIYDGSQESPMEVISETFETTTAGNIIYITLFQGNNSSSHYSLDERVTNVNIYRAITDTPDTLTTNDFYLLYSVDADRSATTAVVDDTGSSDTWNAHSTTSIDEVQFADLGLPRSQSYYARTSVDVFNRAQVSGGSRKVVVEFDHYWDIGCMIKGRAVVHTLKYMEEGVYIEPKRTISISEPGQPDVFHPNSTISFESSGTSDEIVAIRKLGPDRMILADKLAITIVNVSNDPAYWFVERVLPFGLDSAKQICETDGGFIFAGDDHLYAVDEYGRTQILTQGNETLWKSIDFSGASLFYDIRNKLVYIVNSTNSFFYDFKTNQFLKWDAPATPDWPTSGFGGKLYMLDANASTNTFAIWRPKDNSSTIDCEYQSKDLDFGSAFVNKTLRAIHIRMKASNSSTPPDITYLITFDDGTTSTSTFQSTTVANKRIVLSKEFKEMNIKLTASVTVDFEIHEIAVEYMSQGLK